MDHCLEEGLSHLLVARDLLEDPLTLIDQRRQFSLDRWGLLLFVAGDIASD